MTEAELKRKLAAIVDEGESGATMVRDGLLGLLTAVERGEVDRVVVYRVDRFSRRLADFVRLLEFLTKFGAGISFVDGSLESDGGALARLQLNVLSMFAEFEHSMISERLLDAHAAKRARGLRSAGRLPFGYRSDPETRQLILDKANAPFVRSCFERGRSPSCCASRGPGPLRGTRRTRRSAPRPRSP